MAKCSRCGFSNDDHNLYCEFCHFELNVRPRKTPPTEQKSSKIEATETANTAKPLEDITAIPLGPERKKKKPERNNKTQNGKVNSPSLKSSPKTKAPVFKAQKSHSEKVQFEPKAAKPVSGVLEKNQEKEQPAPKNKPASETARKKPETTGSKQTPAPNHLSKKIITILAISNILLLAVAIYYFGNIFDSIDPQHLFREAETLYSQKDFSPALIKYSTFIEQFPEHRLASFASRRITTIEAMLFPTDVEKIERQVIVDQLFAKLDSAFHNGHLSSPEGDNVLFYIKKIREITPNNKAVDDWENRIVIRLRELVEKAYAKNLYTAAIAHCNTILQIYPEDIFARDKIERLTKLIGIRKKRMASQSQNRSDQLVYKELVFLAESAVTPELTDSTKPFAENGGPKANSTANPLSGVNLPQQPPAQHPSKQEKFTTFALPIENFKATSAKAIAGAIVQFAAYEKNIARQSNGITVYVLNAPKVARQLKKYIGEKIGNAQLVDVLEGEAIPSRKPAILYIGETSNAQDFIRYTRQQKILSVAGNPEIIARGVTLGIGASKKSKLEVLINLTAALSEGLDWNPEVMSIANMF